jgi:hypothetical protein
LPPTNQSQPQQATNTNASSGGAAAPLNNGAVGGVPSAQLNQQGNRANVPGNSSVPLSNISNTCTSVQDSVVAASAPQFDHGLNRPEVRNGIPYNSSGGESSGQHLNNRESFNNEDDRSDTAGVSNPGHGNVPVNMGFHNTNLNLSQSSGSTLSQESTMDDINRMKNMNGLYIDRDLNIRTNLKPCSLKIKLFFVIQHLI